jgi:Protein of unknown function (DUF3987)/Bifunctional DNA primase/polymerase, N-terminal/Primase C terminal 2 (PriCT-2)
MTTQLEAALAYARSGIKVFPCKNLPGKPNHKKPHTWSGFKDATTDEKQIRIWWEWKPNALIGTPTGEWFDVVDLDTKKGKNGFESMPDWQARSNVRARTGSGGAHLYFKPDASVACSQNSIAPGVDVRASGGYVILPPSPGYTWESGDLSSPLPEWPADLLERAGGRHKAKSTTEDESSNSTEPPESEVPLGEFAFALNQIDPNCEREIWRNCGFAAWTEYGNDGAKIDEAKAIFAEWSKRAGPPMWDEREFETQWPTWDGRERAANGESVITIATLFKYADEANPNWRRQFDEAVDPIDGADPVDLFDKFDPPPLPRGLLPPIIEDFARQESEAMGSDPACLAMAALTVCAAVTPDRVQVRMKRQAWWFESTRIWTLPVGDPSTMKTPSLAAAVAPMKRLSAAMNDLYKDQVKIYEKLTKEQQEEQDPPTRIVVMLRDTTIEAAGVVLANNPEGVLLFQDELTAWFGSMGKYGNGSKSTDGDRAFWLQAYDGGPYEFNRISRGTTFVPNLSMSVLGGIQPDRIRDIARNSSDDGLLQRMFPIILRPAVQGKDQPRNWTAERYSDLVDRLRTLHVDHPVKFDEGAQRLFYELTRKHLELQQAVETVSKKLSSAIGKYNGMFGRLCLTFHCIEATLKFLNTGEHVEVPPLITLDTARRVAKLMHEFLFPHANAFYGGILGLANDSDRLKATADYILAHRLERVSNRDLARGVRGMSKLTQREVENIFEQLDSFGWLTPRPGRRKLDPRVWHVNPRVHTKFAERAKREVERREQAKKVMAEAFAQRREEQEAA